jgi:ribosomal protein L36
LSVELPIDRSNALLYCAACKKGARTGVAFTAEGVKQLICKGCKKAGRSGVLRVIAKANPKYAAK